MVSLPILIGSLGNWNVSSYEFRRNCVKFYLRYFLTFLNTSLDMFILYQGKVFFSRWLFS